MPQPADVTIAPARDGDVPAWAALRQELWPDGVDEHRRELTTLLAQGSPERLALLATIGGDAVGLAEAAVRHDYVNGCDETPVAFLDGLYVAPPWRRRGVARRLVDRVAAWGRDAGCRAFASNAPIGNDASHALHRALGFAETERVVFFRRELAR